MATPRLLIVFLLLGAVGLLAVQNISPALPLVFLGGRTLALPLAFWLVGAIALGALTTLVLFALITAGSPPSGRRPYPSRSGRRIDYNPETVASAAESASADQDRPPSDSRQGRRTGPADAPRAGGEWGEWTNLRSPSEWTDWGQAAPDRSTTASQGNPPDRSPDRSPDRPQWWGRRREEPAQQVNQSWQELSEGWEDLEDLRYRPRGVSPVEDALDDLDQGWDEMGERPSYRDQNPAEPPHDFEANQSPKRVYRDGSIYSYSYREGSEDRRTDNVYGPEDEADDDWEPPRDRPWTEDGYPEDEAEVDADEADGSDPRLGPDRVVDAEFRVIIPPHRPIAPDDHDDENWVDGAPGK